MILNLDLYTQIAFMPKGKTITFSNIALKICHTDIPDNDNRACSPIKIDPQQQEDVRHKSCKQTKKFMIISNFFVFLIKQRGDSKEKHNYQKMLGALIQSNSILNLTCPKPNSSFSHQNCFLGSLHLSKTAVLNIFGIRDW